MILIERSIFIKPIENIINEKNAIPDMLHLDSGQIADFLVQNFSWIDEGIAKHIEQDCKGSFDYAAVCAEYYAAGGKLSGLLDTLSWKTGRYIRDISERIRSNLADIQVHNSIIFRDYTNRLG